MLTPEVPTRLRDEDAARELDESLRALPPRYEPNAILRWLYRRFFDAIEVDPAWVETVRAASERGTVVYALRNLSLLDFLALDHLTKRFGLPQVRFANNLGLWILEPFGKGVRHAVRARTRDDDMADLRAAIKGRASAALFLKRPPLPLLGRSSTGRGLIEGDDYVRELLELQRQRDAAGDPQPIILLPQVFVWSRRPDKRERSIVDAIIGTREWPSFIRTAGQFLFNYKDVRLKAGEPLDLSEFLAREKGEPSNSKEDHRPGGDATVRRAIYVLLRRLERERRVVVGPVVKPSDRLVDEIVRTPRVRKLIDELAGEGAREKFIVEARARSMLREIAAATEPDVIRAMGTAMTQLFNRIYDGLEVDKEGLERVREASRKGTLILLPSHKSHIDYLFVSYVLFYNDMQVPLIAAGDNLAFFPLGSLFRRAGAFFIRRKIGTDRLYSAVLDAYVHKVVHEGYSIEFFLEGGRSRTGKLLPPKLGLLGMVVDAAFEHRERPIYFVPISIGYERVVEAKSYVRELAGGEKEGESVAGLVRAMRVLAERYGRLNLQFGQILTIDDIQRDAEAAAARSGGSGFVPKRAVVSRLGHQIIYEINRATAVTGGSLTALALLTHAGRGVPRSDLLERCARLLSTLDRLEARVQPSLRDRDTGVSKRAIDEALGLFESAGWLEADRGSGDEHDPVYVIPDEKRLSIDLSKNVIVHFFVPDALIATALLMGGGRHASVRVLRDRVQHLSRLFKYEFMFRADAPFAEIFDQTLRAFVARGDFVITPGPEAPREASRAYDGTDEVHIADTADARAQIELYAATIASFVEGYRVAARSLASLIKGGATAKDLGKRALSVGKRMFLSGEIARREAVQRPVMENAYNAFLDQGYLGKSDGKLVLSESFATIEAVKAVERRIAVYLPGGDV